MAAAFGFLRSSEKPSDGLRGTRNASLPYGPFNIETFANTNFRTWKSILRALQHPSYTSPSLKTTLLSKIHTLQNCAEAYPLAQEQHTTIGDSVTVDGFKYYFTSQQKDLTNELCKEAQLNTTEACRIVLQQGRVGVVELDRLVKAYMEE